MRALILAAGTGSRLMPLTAERPKALVEVAGKPLLGRLLAASAAAGATEAVIVVGHLRAPLEAWLAGARLPLPVRTVHNAAFATAGNAASLLSARAAVDGEDFIKLDGDLLLAPALLERLSAASGSAALIDRSAALDAEAMKVSLRADGSIAAFGKWLAPHEAHGESIGAERIGAADGCRLFDALDALLHREGRRDAYYEDAYHQLAQRGWRVAALPADLPWAEIDDAADLARAHEVARRIDEAGP